MKSLMFVLIFSALSAKADGEIWLPNIPGYASGTQAAGHNGLDVNITGGTITAVNPSVGPTGSAVPSDATFAGAKDNSGNLVGLLTGQQTMANSLACVIASDQSAIPVSIAAPSAPVNPAGSFSQLTNIGSGVASTFTAPAHAVGFIIYGSSSNAQNLRYAVGATASTTSGMRLEPGRDSGYIPVAANISVEAEAGSSQEADVQWVLNQ